MAHRHWTAIARHALPALIVASCLVGCGGGVTPPPVDVLTATIAPEGGTYSFAGGEVVLIVPAGAVASAVEVTLARTTAVPEPTHGTAAGSASAYLLSPADLSFLADVALDLPYDPALIPDLGDEGHARASRAGADRWADIPGTSPAAAGRVTAPIRQLGTFRSLIRLDTGAADAPAYIPDPLLVTALRAALAKPTGQITAGELAGISEVLDLSNTIGLSDITGLEYCTATPDIELWNTDIVDLSPLAELTQLTRLSLGKNHITDVSPLSGLTSLRHLFLTYNGVSDITPLAGLPLEELSLSANPVADFSALDSIATLRTFYMAHSHLTNVPFAAHLQQVTDLYLHDNDLTDISALAALTNLNAVHLDDNQLTDISPLVANAGLGSGDDVDLINNPLDLTPGSAASLAIADLEARGVTVLR